MILLYIALGVILVIAGTWVLSNWGSHLLMVKDCTKDPKWGTFKTFITKFNEYGDKLIIKKMFPKSFFYYKDDEFPAYCEVHANIIMFETKGLRLYPHSYVRFFIWSLGKQLERKKYEELWSEK